MSRHLNTRTFLRLLAVGAAVAVANLGLAGTASATETDDECGYAAPAITETVLTLALNSVKVGEANTATATVTIEGKKVESGTVTFAVAGYASQTVALSNGTATYALPTDLPAGTYEVTADAEVPGCTQPSGDVEVLEVEEDEIAGSSSTVARPPTGLPSVGLGAGVSIVALGGALLLATGALLLLRFRRLAPGRHRG